MRILLKQLVQFHKRIEGCSVISHHHKVIGLKKLMVFLYLKVFDACKNLSVENVELSIKTLNSVLEKYELQSKANKEIISLSRKKVTINLTAFLTSLLSQMINFGFLTCHIYGVVNLSLLTTFIFSFGFVLSTKNFTKYFDNTLDSINDYNKYKKEEEKNLENQVKTKSLIEEETRKLDLLIESSLIEKERLEEKRKNEIAYKENLRKEEYLSENEEDKVLKRK